MKLLPNLPLPCATAAEGSGADATVMEPVASVEFSELETLFSTALWLEPKRRLPANSCLLDLRVVDVDGLRVVDDVEGAAVVLVVVVLDLIAFAVKRVWNLLFRLPNLFLVDAESAEFSAAELVVS